MQHSKEIKDIPDLRERITFVEFTCLVALASDPFVLTMFEQF